MMESASALAYLARIDDRGPVEPTPDTLQRLHVAHLLHVPFENLDIHLGRPIVLDVDRFYHKIVTERRGGFCYELNGLFAELLRTLGFDVTLLSARVAGQDGEFGLEFDHLVLLVQLEQPWLADVGFGDSFRQPLPLQADVVTQQDFGTYRLLQTDATWFLQALGDSGEWQPEYAFTGQPRLLADFAEMCHFQQTSPASHFTQKRVCSRATPEGRITLSDRRLITSRGSRREERVLSNEAEVAAVLAREFGIELRPGPQGSG